VLAHGREVRAEQPESVRDRSATVVIAAGRFARGLDERGDRGSIGAGRVVGAVPVTAALRVRRRRGQERERERERGGRDARQRFTSSTSVWL
jgi:hypothetical protein